LERKLKESLDILKDWRENPHKISKPEQELEEKLERLRNVLKGKSYKCNNCFYYNECIYVQILQTILNERDALCHILEWEAQTLAEEKVPELLNRFEGIFKEVVRYFHPGWLRFHIETKQIQRVCNFLI